MKDITHERSRRSDSRERLLKPSERRRHTKDEFSKRERIYAKNMSTGLWDILHHVINRRKNTSPK